MDKITIFTYIKNNTNIFYLITDIDNYIEEKINQLIYESIKNKIKKKQLLQSNKNSVQY